jgi:hypothetical protein
MSLEAIKKIYKIALHPRSDIASYSKLLMVIAEHLLETSNQDEITALATLPDEYISPCTFASEHTFVASNTLTKYCNNGEFKGYCCKLHGKWYVDKNWVMQYFLRNPRYKRKIEAEKRLTSGMLKN